jgi:nitroreductase
MDLLPEIKNRTSVRDFLPDPVSKAQLERILEAARLAPSAKNRQAWRFIVVQDSALRERMESACFGQEYVGNAPAIVACCTTNVDYKMPNGQLSYPIDIAIAASFMMLQAVREKLGTCMITTYDEQDVRVALSVPYSMRVVMLLLIGHPASVGERVQKFPLRRIASYDHW